MAEILIVDVITARPGLGRAVHAAVMADYAPGAAGRGLRLRESLVSPPLWLASGGGNVLTYVWSAADLPAWWRQRLAAAADPAVAAFWAALAARIVRRERRVCEAAELHV